MEAVPMLQVLRRPATEKPHKGEVPWSLNSVSGHLGTRGLAKTELFSRPFSGTLDINCDQAGTIEEGASNLEKPL